MKLDRAIYYYCKRGKNPNMGKIRACCIKCPHMGQRPKKNAQAKGSRRGDRRDLGRGEDGRDPRDG